MQVVEDSRKFMKKDAVAIIGSGGLMGSKMIVIVPGTGGKATLADNDVIQTVRQVSMDEILFNLKVTSENAAHITGDLSAIMEEVRAGRGTIGMLLMDSTFAYNVNAAMVNIKQGAGGFKQNMDAAGHNFLLRGYIKKKEKLKDKKEEDKIKEKEDKEKAKEKEKEEKEKAKEKKNKAVPKT
jgi:phospholipid/cholesterol/gamma-HCH transport system substrate-binding protein